MSDSPTPEESDPQIQALQHVRGLAHHFAERRDGPALREASYTDDPKLTVDISVPEHWRNGNTSISRFIPHTYNPDENRPFPNDFAHSENLAITAWLAPSFIGEADCSQGISESDRMLMQYKAAKAVDALSQLHGIPLEHRLIIPRLEHAKIIGAHTCGGIVIGAPFEYQERFLNEVVKGLNDLRQNHTLTLPKQLPSSLISLAKIDQKTSASIKLDAIAGMALHLPELHDVDEHGAIHLQVPIKDSARTKSSTIQVETDYRDNHYDPHHVLVLWLHKDFRLLPNQQRAAGAGAQGADDKFQAAELKQFLTSLSDYCGAHIECDVTSPTNPHEPIPVTIYVNAEDPEMQKAILLDACMLLEPLIEAHQRARREFKPPQGR